MTDIDNLLKRLNSSDLTLRVEAIEQAGRLSPSEAARLVRRADNLMDKTKLTAGVYAVGTSVLLLFVIAISSALLIQGIQYLADVLWFVPFALWAYMLKKQSPRAIHSLEKVIASWQSVEYIPLLLTMHTSVFKFVVIDKPIKATLTRLLLMEPGQKFTLTRDQRKMLTRSFNSTLHWEFHNSELALAILHTLAEIGDNHDIDNIRRLTKLRTDYTGIHRIPGVSPEEATKRALAIREAATVCLAAIESRQANQNDTQTLLRPSEKTGGETELLRPVASRPDAEPQQLLRASQKQENEGQ